MALLPRLLDAIAAPAAVAGETAQRHLDRLTQPPPSLGRPEEFAVRLVLLRGRPPPVAPPGVVTIAAGADLLATGEMGIGNPTAASAIPAAITGAAPEAVTGRGTGVDDATWRRKVEVVRRALAVNAPDARDGLDVLVRVGGFEIAGLVGVVLAGAAHRVPVALDGFISGAAALVAVALAPDAGWALFASHRSAEPGHAVALAHLGLEPYLDLGLRLGEGTGAALFVHLARAAALIYTEMATFKSAGVSTSEGASMAPSEASPRDRIAPAKPAPERRR